MGLDSGKKDVVLFLPIIFQASKEHEIIHPNFRQSTLIIGFADNATAVIFSRCSGSFGGSGVVVFRSKEDRSWTAPIVINARMSLGIEYDSTTIDCITFLQSNEMVTIFQENNELTIDTQDQGRLDYITFMKLNGSFFGSIEQKYTFSFRDELNLSFYSSRVNAEDTKAGLFSGKSRICLCYLIYSRFSD